MRTGMPAMPRWQVSCGRYLRIPAPRQELSPARARKFQDSHAKAYDCAHFQPEGR
jgi:hypothetical protein